MEDEYFGVVRWCREDLIEALELCCIEPTEEAVTALYNKVNTHWFTELMTEHGWSFIFSCLNDLVLENKLHKKEKEYDHE